MLPDFVSTKLSKYIDLNREGTLIKETVDSSDILTSSNTKLRSVINLEKVNNIRRINKFHEAVNQALTKNGIYVSCTQTLESRRKLIREKTPLGFRNIVCFFDFIFRRVLPKLPFIKNIFFVVTLGLDRVISKAETLGRLISCGFEILEYFEFENLLYVVSKKTKRSEYNLEASYSLIIKLNRYGICESPLKVYKFRTMYPYSEYLQEYVYKQNKLQDGGKFKNDFRVTSWGKFMRRFWIDELPMIYNWVKGDLKFIGVRPLSPQYIGLYPKKIRTLRMKLKPGLLPPFYADLPKTLDEICKSEEVYIRKYISSPLKTQWVYFWKIVSNIIVRRSRSK